MAFDLETYLTNGVENVVRSILKTSLSCPEETAFLLKYAASAKQAAKRRARALAEGVHVPVFLIASITSQCNLHCAGCYARSLNTCEDGAPVGQLTGEDWGRVFREARDLGVSFILLAGGEPLVRRDVLTVAAGMPELIFPIFTNGTLLRGETLSILEKHRNLMPVISLEGDEQRTDARRGGGVYRLVETAMGELQKRRILFGCSITVTRENALAVTEEAFLARLAEQGCKLVVFTEYVPVSPETEDLALTEDERSVFDGRIQQRRQRFQELFLVSFPGDEKSSDGCLAAGRGFFHINSHGGAEPCPFSPYSDVNVKETSLREAMNSPLFTALRAGGVLVEDHKGGCVLYERRSQVEALLAQKEPLPVR